MEVQDPGFLQSILSSLNERQCEAVTAPITNPLQIRAGPGTGKTKVLVARVAYLLVHKKVAPQHIIVTTFTKKAAKEMVERLNTLLEGSGISVDKLIIGTFHSISYRIIQKYGASEGLVGMTVANEKDASQILEDVIDNEISDSDWKSIALMADADLAPFVAKPDDAEQSSDSSNRVKLDKKKVMRQISRLKAHAIFPEAYEVQKDSNHLLSCVYSRYQRRLSDHKLLDFDDCLLYCLKVVSLRPVLNFVQHTLVDEFQDTNEIQLQLMYQFSQVSNIGKLALCGVTIVGDLDQGIYAFRDAQLGNFEKMMEFYAQKFNLHCKVVTLTENYRSTSDILSFLERVMRQQPKRTIKDLVSQIPHSFKPIKGVLDSADEEARWVAYQISHVMKLPRLPFSYSDVAILVRSAYQTRALESELVKKKIPYTIVKGRAFWERKEVVAVIDYLRCIANKNDRLAYFRCLNYPKRGFGPVAMAELERIFQEYSSASLRVNNDILEQVKAHQMNRATSEPVVSLCFDLLQAISRKEIKSSFGAKLLSSLDNFITVIKQSRKILNDGFQSDEYGDHAKVLGDAFDHVFSNSGLKTEFSDDENRVLNVEELKSQLLQYTEPEVDDSFPEYYNDITEENEIEIIDDSEAELEVITFDDIENEVNNTPGEAEKGQAFLLLFLSLVILYETDSSAKDEKDLPKVAISTIHGAKGLEWPIVFVPGLGEGLLPASFALDGTEESIHEERRCFYVATTRAKMLLYISAYTEAAGSLNWGRKPIEKPSRFLLDLDLSFSAAPFESEVLLKNLYETMKMEIPKGFDFTRFNEQYTKGFNLYVKQTIEMDQGKSGFVTGTDARNFGWNKESSRLQVLMKRKAATDNRAPTYIPKRVSCAPFKPVFANARIGDIKAVPNKHEKDQIVLSSTAAKTTLRAPTYIPQRAKHKRRLGTR